MKVMREWKKKLERRQLDRLTRDAMRSETSCYHTRCGVVLVGPRRGRVATVVSTWWAQVVNRLVSWGMGG